MRVSMFLVLLMPAVSFAQGGGVGAVRTLAETQARAAAETQNKINAEAAGATNRSPAGAPGPAAQPLDPRSAWLQAKKLHIIKPLPRSPKPPKECLKPAAFKEGEKGYVECWPCAVVQVTSQNSVILNLAGVPVWLEEYPTKGLVRNEPVRLVGPVKFAEGKPHPGRSPAMPELRSVQFISVEQLADAATQPDNPSPSVRVFTDSTGKYTFKGTFIELKGEIVHFLRADNGKPLEVKLTQLSEADQRWIRELKR